MRDWVAFILACGAGFYGALTAYLFGFGELMTATWSGIGAFVIYCLVFPVTAGLAVFAVVFRIVGKRAFSIAAWAQFYALAMGLALGLFALVANDLIDDEPASLIFLALVIGCGRFSTLQRRHA